MLCFWSYFDDCSDDKRRRYVAIGGLIAGESHWNGCGFHVDWAVATQRLKEPFHATECETQKGQFKDWTKEECDQLMARLVSILVDKRLHGFASVVPVDLYRRLFPDAGEYDPYYLAVTHSIVGLASIEDVSITISSGSVGWNAGLKTVMPPPDAQETFTNPSKSSERWPDADMLMPTPNFKDKGLWTLQAADLVAREAFKHFDNIGKRDTRIPVKRMLSLLNFARWNEETLETCKVL